MLQIIHKMDKNRSEDKEEIYNRRQRRDDMKNGRKEIGRVSKRNNH